MGENRQKIARRKFILRFAYEEVDFFLTDGDRQWSAGNQKSLLELLAQVS